MGMQKDSVSLGDGSGSEGVAGDVGASGGVGVGASVFDVSTGVVTPGVPLREQKPLLDQIPLMRPEIVEKRITAPLPKKVRKKALSKQEWTFVKEYVTGDGEVTLKEAARRAGYPERTLEWHARKLTDPHQSPHIVQAIQELRTELAVKHGTTFERHMKDMQRIRDMALAAGAYSAAVAAEYRRGQALGTIYVERKEIRVGTIDSMSKEEVMKKLEEISKLYGGSSKPAIVSDQSEVLDVEPVAPSKPTVLERLSNAEKIRKGLLEKGAAPVERPLFHSDED
jgi:phage terminase small subunit